MPMHISAHLATTIADVLNTRGFVTHDDVPICTDGAFGALLCANEELLRACGYSGGELQSWSTAFRLSCTYTYGVTDSERSISNERLDAYTLASGDFLEESDLLVADLQPLLIGLQYRCECGEDTDVVNSTLPYRSRHSRIHTISASCSVCKRTISEPRGIYRLFQTPA